MPSTIYWPSENPDNPGQAQVPGNPALVAPGLRLPARFQPRGFRRQPKPTALVTQPEVGPVRIRGRTTQRIYNIRGNIVLTEAQVDVFENFYYNTLARGTRSFNWVDPLRQHTRVEMIFYGQAAPAINAAGPITYLAVLELEMYS